MRVTLVHNPTAGDGSLARDELCALLRAAGHEPRYVLSKSKRLDRMLDDASDLVLVAGGDGTVAKVARYLRGRGVPMALLPLGTANNIATTLGVSGQASDIIDRLDDAELRTLDVATARASWGTTSFVESAGVGAFADMLHHAARPGASSESPIRGQRLRDALDRARIRHRTVDVDGGDLSGDYLLVIALSIRCVGPGIELAPEADPGDGMLDVVFVREEDRAVVDAYLSGLPSNSKERFPLPALRARRIRLEWDVSLGHVDDELWPADALATSTGDAQLMVDLEVVDPPLQILVTPPA